MTHTHAHGNGEVETVSEGDTKGSDYGLTGVHYFSFAGEKYTSMCAASLKLLPRQREMEHVAVSERLLLWPREKKKKHVTIKK